MPKVAMRKRKRNTNSKALVEDNETDIQENLEFPDEEDGDSDSSVYSELEEGDDNDSEDSDDNETNEENEEDDTDDSGEEKEDSNDENGDKDGIEENENKAKSKNTSNSETKLVKKKKAKDEYEYDSSDEEDIRNTIGNIPVQWYDDYDHLGYDLDGKQIRKPKRGDELDTYLRKMEDPNAGITVQDPQTGQDVVLTEKQVEELRRIVRAKVPSRDYDMYSDVVNWFSSEVMKTPLRAIPESKKSFLPSITEKKRVSKMLHSIKMGWMKTTAQRMKEKEQEKDSNKFYMLWSTDDQAEDIRRINDLIPAPKMKLPDHAESYNPPPEYLFTEKEKQRWDELEEEPYKRKCNFIPGKFDSLRKVPAYKNFIPERFQRCLDLYLAPRARKMRLTIQPEDLLPQLPKPQDLQPFPTACVLTFKGHMNMIRTLSIDTSGMFIASGSDDGTVKIWSIETGYCMRTFAFGKVAVKSIAWCPNENLCLLAVAVENNVVLLNGKVGDKVIVDQTDELLKDPPEMGDYMPPERVKTAVTWALPTPEDKLPSEALLSLKFFKPVKQVTWHGKGDYFATVLTDGQNRSVLINRLSKWTSQVPFNKAKGLIQCVLFHPFQPFLFVANQRHIRVYNLQKQELTKTLQSSARWISSLAIHPKGDNVIIGSYDKRVQWFDLDLSLLPYKVMRYHYSAVRSVAYHKRYPLFASCSDDTSIIVSHGMVYNDLEQNPLIVPVKLLKGHTKYDDLGIMDVIWHPKQPWLFSAGADGYIKRWS